MKRLPIQRVECLPQPGGVWVIDLIAANNVVMFRKEYEDADYAAENAARIADQLCPDNLTIEIKEEGDTTIYIIPETP